MSITETRSSEKTQEKQEAVAQEKAWSMPNWAITAISLIVMIGCWQAAAPFIDPLFGSYPSQIFSSFLVMMESGVLVKAFWQSVQPFFAGYLLAALIGIPAGIVSAVKKGTAWDYGANLFALWGISTPNFWLGILLIFLFSIELGWLPASGYVPLTENWRASLAATIMPAFVLGNAISAILMRHTRSAMLQVLESDYVRTARAKGLSERSVILKHAMRNALTPIITLGALELGTLLSGAVLTEQIFSIPGFGKLIVDAVFNRDYAVVQGVVLVTATVYITLNLIADVAYVLVNPRLRG